MNLDDIKKDLLRHFNGEVIEERSDEFLEFLGQDDSVTFNGEVDEDKLRTTLRDYFGSPENYTIEGIPEAYGRFRVFVSRIN